MESIMRFLPGLLLAFLMWVFLGLGCYGLYQQITKQLAGHHSSVERGR